MESQIVFLTGSLLYLCVYYLQDIVLKPIPKSYLVKMRTFSSDTQSQIMMTTESMDRESRIPDRKHIQIRKKNSETNTEPIEDKPILLPYKRTVRETEDPFTNLKLLKSILPYEKNKEITGGITDNTENKKKRLMPLYGTTSPVPRKSMLALPSRQFQRLSNE